MSQTTGHDLIIQRILNLSSYNVVIPNGTAKELPRYTLQTAGGQQFTSTLDGMTDATAEVLVTVETAAGTYNTESNQMISALVAMFPPGLRIGANSKVSQAPDTRPPLPVKDGVYSVPVYVRLDHNS